MCMFRKKVFCFSKPKKKLVCIEILGIYKVCSFENFGIFQQKTFENFGIFHSNHLVIIDEFQKKFSTRIQQRYILHSRDIRKEQDLILLPMYMSMFL